MALPPWKFLLAASITAFFGPFQFSYYGAIMNIPQQSFLQFINETNMHRYGTPMPDTTLSVLWGWIVSILPVGGLIGSLATPLFADRLGRKYTLMVLSSSVAMIGSLITCFFHMAQSYEMLAVGRFFIGFGAHIATAMLPVYMSECSPTRWRGLMGNLQNFFTNLIPILGCVIAMPMALGRAKSLPYLLGLGIIPAFLQIVSSFFLPETPKFLYMTRKNVEAAKKSLKFWYAASDEQPLDEKAIFKEFDREAAALNQELGFMKAMRIPCFRKIFFTAVVIKFCQRTAAVGPIFAYSTDIFMRLGFTAEVAAICTDMLSVANAMGALLVIPFIEKFSRRGCYFVSYGILIGTLLIYVIFAVMRMETGWFWPSYVALISIISYSVIFNMGSGALTFIIPAEISPQAIRSTVLSVSNAVGAVMDLICMFVYPPVELEIGAWTMLIFIVPVTVGLVYLYKVLPETGKRSVADILSDYKSSKEQNDGEMIHEKF